MHLACGCSKNLRYFQGFYLSLMREIVSFGRYYKTDKTSAERYLFFGVRPETAWNPLVFFLINCSGFSNCAFIKLKLTKINFNYNQAPKSNIFVPRKSGFCF